MESCCAYHPVTICMVISFDKDVYMMGREYLDDEQIRKLGKRKNRKSERKSNGLGKKVSPQELSQCLALSLRHDDESFVVFIIAMVWGHNGS